MKKTLVAAITTAIAVGAAGTAFAAANPFSDVPNGHWAYAAVTTLAKDGVVEGYGDGTFKGSQNITRYEMAQIVAKAIAKNDVAAADQATIDKLAAEFADELDNLGVRVANLEKKTDNVKFDGFYRLRFENFSKEVKDGPTRVPNTAKSYFEVYTAAQVNDNWTARMKTKIESDMKSDSNATTTATNAYADGKIGDVKVKLGKFDTVDGYAYTHEDPMSGVQLTFGNKLKTRLSGGRISNPNNYFKADYAAAEFTYKANKATNFVADYHSLGGIENGYKKIAANDDYGLWDVGFDTLFAKNLRFVGLYAKSDANVTAAIPTEGYFAELDYKRLDVKAPGSFMVMLRNFQLTDATAISSRYDAYTHGNVKGTELGAAYCPAKNVEAGLKYFWGEDVTSGVTKDFFRGEVKFFF